MLFLRNLMPVWSFHFFIPLCNHLDFFFNIRDVLEVHDNVSWVLVFGFLLLFLVIILNVIFSVKTFSFLCFWLLWFFNTWVSIVSHFPSLLLWSIFQETTLIFLSPLLFQLLFFNFCELLLILIPYFMTIIPYSEVAL